MDTKWQLIISNRKSKIVVVAGNHCRGGMYATPALFCLFRVLALGQIYIISAEARKSDSQTTKQGDVQNGRRKRLYPPGNR